MSVPDAGASTYTYPASEHPTWLRANTRTLSYRAKNERSLFRNVLPVITAASARTIAWQTQDSHLLLTVGVVHRSVGQCDMGVSPVGA